MDDHTEKGKTAMKTKAQNQPETHIRYAFDESGRNMPISLSAEDIQKLPPRGSRGSCEVTDQATGQKVKLRRASCGLPRCLCALAIVKG